MKSHHFFILFLSITTTIYSQVTFLVNSIPKKTSENESIYISGDFEGWTGGQEKYKLSRIKNTYSITLLGQSSAINYKFTKGSWASVETDSVGNNIENRTYLFKNKKETIKVEILNWVNAAIKKSTASKNVSVLSDHFNMPQLNRTRRIWVYLPPNYTSTKESYPVIYMHDGQNLFDNATSYAGEWEVDETLNQIYKEKGFELIVVGIDHANEKRLDEYSPWNNSKYQAEGQGDAYLEFIVETLKPYIDKQYRTLVDKNNTGLMGSSMGGLISHYGALKYSDIFGKIGVFSPAFGYSDSSYDFASKHGNIKDIKMYFMAGDKESPTMVSNMNNMLTLMKAKGFDQKKIRSKVIKNGEHNEKLWRENFEKAIVWLYSE